MIKWHKQYHLALYEVKWCHYWQKSYVVPSQISSQTLTAACQGLESLHQFPGQCQCEGAPGHRRLQKRPTLCWRTFSPRHRLATQGFSSAPYNRHWCPFLEGRNNDNCMTITDYSAVLIQKRPRMTENVTAEGQQSYLNQMNPAAIILYSGSRISFFAC